EHAVALQGIASARAAIGGDPDIATDKHPAVLSALATRDKASYALSQTTVRAPADGMVSQASSFKLGQFVAPGTPLFSLVETSDSWVEANFKETQLTHMKPGQKAEIVLDTYPGHAFEATVEAIGAGTGAEFSLLPAQNATGNWVKVTQRIPVRLKLDAAGADLALRTGMSASVSVDTGVSRGFGNLLGSANAAE
ncbi:HlyD family efflux transporter periplasmic adaptor subunit, partial [Rhizobiaceae sp. 2RAB30]